MVIKPENRRLILSLKKSISAMETSSGVSMETDFILSPILYSSVDTYSPGQIVCVPKNRVKKVPVDDSWEYSCFDTDVIYTKISNKEPKDSQY